MFPWKCYNCERCGKDFASPAALKQHFQAKHVGRALCDQCGNEVSRDQLKAHEQAVHHGLSTQAKALEDAFPHPRVSRFIRPETSVTCRMCHKMFGTIFGKEQHERSYHHFTPSKRARLSLGFSMNNVLDMRGSEQLQNFVVTILRPQSGPEKMACAKEVGALIQMIGSCCPVPVSRIVKGGSYLKGTDTKNWSVVDVVLFSDSFANLDDFRSKLNVVLEGIEYNLKRSQMTHRIMFGKRTKFSIRFKFACYKNLHVHDFDVLPSLDFLGAFPSKGTKKNLYTKMLHCGDREELQLISPCLLHYQVEFVKTRTVGVKDLMRLVRHWLQTSMAKPGPENRFRQLPSSYTLELLTLHVWEQAGKPLFFSLLQGFRAVLTLLMHYPEINVTWYQHYSPASPLVRKALQTKSRPFILDPANPTLNICENCNAWDEVAMVARRSLLKPLLNGVQATGPWLFTDH